MIINFEELIEIKEQALIFLNILKKSNSEFIDKYEVWGPVGEGQMRGDPICEVINQFINDLEEHINLMNKDKKS